MKRKACCVSAPPGFRFPAFHFSEPPRFRACQTVRVCYQQGMKSLAILISLLGLLSASALGQETKTNASVQIPATEAKQHINSEATVTGKIVEVNKTAKVVHLNFDQPFPNQPFEAVIFATRTNLFPEVDQLKGKTVEVTGKITEYHNRAEIILNNTNQLKVVESAAEQKQGPENFGRKR